MTFMKIVSLEVLYQMSNHFVLIKQQKKHHLLSANFLICLLRVKNFLGYFYAIYIYVYS